MGGQSTRRVHPFVIGLLAGLATASIFAVAGVLLLKQGGLGRTLFLLLPFATGFAVAMAAYPRSTAWFSLVLLALWGVICLIAFKLEGLLCCLMALPLILPGLICGALFGFLIRKWLRSSETRLMCIGLVLVSVLTSGWVEQASPTGRTEVVTTSVFVDAPAEFVWKALNTGNKITVEKTLLHKFGLPTPVRCSLSQENERVRGKRFCYFEQGEIEEEITVWDPPHTMHVKMVNSTLPGRHWLSFVDANYVLQTEGDGTRIIRTTRIASELRPAWYWHVMERWGVEAEHRYVLRQLMTDVIHDGEVK